MIVALAAVVLIGALALAVDWGYGLTQRRVMQNASDAAALGAARLLATSVVEVDATTHELAFTVHGEDVWCEAKTFVDSNDPFRPGTAVNGFTLEFGDDSDPIVWTAAARPLAGCGGGGGDEVVPADTVYVRVRADITYRSLVASVIGRPGIEAAASARARISGMQPTFAGPVWPMVRHYDPADFSVPCPPDTCDPTEVDPIVFWSANEDDVVYGSFKGLVDASRYSPNYQRSLDEDVGQLITQWDNSATYPSSNTDYSAGPDKPDQGQCPSHRWDTAGNEDSNQYDKACSIPNWFYYSYHGSLSLGTVWGSAADPLPDGQELPDAPPLSRAVCQDRDADLIAPSCVTLGAGDWVETAQSSGNLGSNVAENMKSLIGREGSTGPFSDRLTQSGKPYGKALVVLVYLWDCGESFDKAGGTDKWTPSVVGGGDCSLISANGSDKVPDRVHLFSVAPFTFYEGLVTSSEIEGYWGGQYGDVVECLDCPKNPFSNAVHLVPDDGYAEGH